MNKDQYTVEREKLINLLGKPEYDFDNTPLNESAKEIAKIKSQYMAFCRESKKNQAKLDREQEKQFDLTNSVSPSVSKFEQALSSIPEAKHKEWRKYPLPAITVLEKDLKGFDEVEAAIVKDYLEDLDLEPKQLALKYGRSYQFVAGLLNSKAVELLKVKYFGLALKSETMKSVLRAVKAGDNKILESAVEFLKIFGTNEQQGSKAIDDPKAEEKLRQLGDNLADI